MIGQCMPAPSEETEERGIIVSICSTGSMNAPVDDALARQPRTAMETLRPGSRE